MHPIDQEDEVNGRHPGCSGNAHAANKRQEAKPGEEHANRKLDRRRGLEAPFAETDPHPSEDRREDHNVTGIEELEDRRWDIPSKHFFIDQTVREQRQG